MSFTAQRRTAVGLAEATSAQNAVRAGAALDTNQLGGAGLVCECIADLTTSSVTATFTPQVSWDGTNWANWKEPQAPAQVVVATGGGSQVVTRTALAIDKSVIGALFFRCNATLAGAQTASADKTTINYRFARGIGV
jgi:hypothetical protein